MYIKSLYIRNFRNFAETVFEFTPTLTALVGENGIGKSNALFAIRLLFDSNLGKQSRTLTEEDFHFADSIEKEREVLISAKIVDFDSNVKNRAYCAKWTTTDGEAVVTYRFRPNEIIRQDMENAKAAELELAKAPAEAEVKEDHEKRPVFTIDDYDFDRVGGLNMGGQFADLATVTIYDNFGTPADRELNNFLLIELPAVRDVVRDMAMRRISPLVRLIELAAAPTDVKEKVEAIIAKANLDIRSDKFFESLESSIDETYEDLAAVPDTLTVRIGLSDPKFSSALRSMSLLLSDAAMEEADMSRNGLGFNNLLYIALLLEYFKRRALDNVSSQLLLIEEPEAHLHPNAQVALVRRLAAKTHQSIVTTHSPVAAGALGIKRIVALARNGANTAATNLASAMSASVSDVRDIDRYLDANRGGLLFAREVILVEGLSEELLLRAFASAHGINLAKLNVAVVAVAGSHFALFERLFAIGALAAKCHIIADGDFQNSKEWLQKETPDDGEPINLMPARGGVTWSRCRTTLEMTLAQPENADWIGNAIETLGAPLVAAGVRKKLSSAANDQVLLAQLATVRYAKRVGKGRFAQILASTISADIYMPGYISMALREFV